MMKRLAAALLLATAALAVVALGMSSFSAAPAEIRADENGAQVWFQVSRDQVFFPGECVTARWQVEGIREVYLNGEGVIGAGDEIVCPAAGAPTLRIITLNDTTVSYTLPVRIIALNLVTYILLAVIILSLGIVVRLNAFAPLNRIADQLQRGWLALRHRLTAAVSAGQKLLNNPLITIGLLTLFGAALRFHDLAHRSLVQDEAVLHLIASGSITDVIHQNALWNSSPPLYPLMVNLVLLTGDSELLLRALSALASIAVIPMMYVLSRQFFSRAAAYGCALIVTVSLGQVYFAQYAREYSLTMLLAALAIFVYWRFRRAPTRRNLIILAACWVTGVLMQYGLPFLILALNLLLVSEFLIQKRWRQYLTSVAVLQVMLLLAVGVVYFISLRQHLPRFGSDSYVALGYWNQIPNSLVPMVFNNTLGIFRFAFGESVFGQRWDTGWFVALAGLGLLVVLFERGITPRVRALFLLPFCLAIIAALLQLYPYAGYRQAIYLTVFVYLFAAAALDFLLSLSSRRVIRVLAVVLMLGVVVTSLDNVQRYYAAPGFDDVQPAVSHIVENLQDSDRILVVSYADAMFNYYYARHHSEEVGSRIFYSGNRPVEYGAVIDHLRQQSGRIWVMLANQVDVFESFIAQQPYSTQTTRPLRWTNVDLYLIDG